MSHKYIQDICVSCAIKMLNGCLKFYMLVAYGTKGFKHWEVVFPSDMVQNPLEFSTNRNIFTVQRPYGLHWSTY